jgi:hypothetical protein
VAGERAETAIGSGDHPLPVADHGHRFLEPTRDCSPSFAHVDTGFDLFADHMGGC